MHHHNYFTIKLHHKGILHCVDGENKYYGREIDYTDWCNPSNLSMRYLNKLVQMLGCNGCIIYCWRIQGKCLNYGLIRIEEDEYATIT